MISFYSFVIIVLLSSVSEADQSIIVVSMQMQIILSLSAVSNPEALVFLPPPPLAFEKESLCSVDKGNCQKTA